VLQEEMQRLLRQDDSWHKDQDAPANIMVATSPQHIKSVLEAADPNSIVVLDFFAPHCRACRGMWGAKKKLAATNPDIIFMKVDATNSQLVPMVKALGVTRMPWFIIMRGGTGDQLASFTANLDTFNVFRAEVAAAKTCTDPQCITSDDEPSR
jgi:thiol:disulfide interchange protein